MTSLLFSAMPKTNENKNTAGKYSDTYFRINTDAYSFDKGWNDKQKHLYETELNRILTEQGWKVYSSAQNAHSETATKGRSFLYLHPQNYSGVCENAEREKLFEAFKDAKTFTCRSVDVYEEIFDMTDEQMYEKLNAEKTSIEVEILEALTTKRSNLFVTDVGYFGVNGNVAKEHSIKRLAIDGMKSFDGIDSRTEGICVSFVNEIFNELVADGRIISANTKNGIGYRTAKKTELIKQII